MKKHLGLIIAAATLLFVGAGCAGQPASVTPPAAPPAAAPSAAKPQALGSPAAEIDAAVNQISADADASAEASASVTEDTSSISGDSQEVDAITNSPYEVK